MITRSYSELITIPSFIERFRYLMLDGSVGEETFGSDRYLNQLLYNSPEWKRCRRDIILRDNGCDLAMDGYDIHGHVYVHHMDPITVEDILRKDPKIFDPENLITVSFNTHQGITYGSENILQLEPPERRPNDTVPWRL